MLVNQSPVFSSFNLQIQFLTCLTMLKTDGCSLSQLQMIEYYKNSVNCVRNFYLFRCYKACCNVSLVAIELNVSIKSIETVR